MTDTREPCDYDYNGLRQCCGTLHLAAHAGDCPVSRKLQEAILDHEKAFRHAQEAAGD